MTKHEKLDGKTRAARYRAAMRAKGYRLRQFWVPDTAAAAPLAGEIPHRLKEYWLPDTSTPEFREMARRACEAINNSPHHAEEMAWAEAMAAEIWDSLPPYDAPLPGDPDYE